VRLQPLGHLTHRRERGLIDHPGPRKARNIPRTAPATSKRAALGETPGKPGYLRPKAAFREEAAMAPHNKTELPSADEALPGRPTPLRTATHHFLTGRRLKGPYPDDFETATFAMGCFWGVERKFWQVPGVWTTAVGYVAGITPNPTYEEVCSGLTGHTEAVLVVFDPGEITYEELLKTFWEGHDPTQGMRQGNDVGIQYRSGIYTHSPEQVAAAEASKPLYAKALAEAGHGATTTEILSAGPFYFAEDYHQQYLAKVPNGYCGVGGTGVSCPLGVGVAA
jgi:peptide-methionine (S)-S-oxide reductase